MVVDTQSLAPHQMVQTQVVSFEQREAMLRSEFIAREAKAKLRLEECRERSESGGRNEA